jgi:ABC-2 type transport system permease protein
MNNVVRAELLKAGHTRSMWATGVIGVALCVLWAVTTGLGLSPEADDQAVRDVYAMAAQGYLLAIVLGVVLTAGEYRHQTITWAFLVTPRRGRVIAAKLLAAGILGLLLGLAAALATGAATATLLVADGRAPLVPGVALVLAGSAAVTALWGVFGAALLRNQVAGVAFAFLWSFYAEWFLVWLLPDVGRWTPTGAARAFSGWSRDGLAGFDGQPIAGDLLPVWAGGAVFLAYVLVLAVAARLVSVRRDVT